jgi:hypothetical protein
MALQKISLKRWPDANAFGGRFERYAQLLENIRAKAYEVSLK